MINMDDVNEEIETRQQKYEAQGIDPVNAAGLAEHEVICWLVGMETGFKIAQSNEVTALHQLEELFAK